MMWSRQHIKRILFDFSLKVRDLPFYGDGSFYEKHYLDWKDDVGLDSMELMTLAAHANSFFTIFETANPPYLLSSTKVEVWIDLIYEAKRLSNEYLSFSSSGTGGQAKTIRHSVAFLQREIDFLAGIFKTCTYIVPYVPSYTIYGFLLTVGLPEKLSVPVLHPSDMVWKNLSGQPLIVSTPFHWQLLLSSFPHHVLNCLGVSATAPLYDSLYKSIELKGIKLTELYGSTETAGIGYRESSQEPFRLIPYWQLKNNEEVWDQQNNKAYPLMDYVEKAGDNQFVLLGRKDNQINIAGKLVDLNEVNNLIKTLPNVKECRLSTKSIDGNLLFQAELVLNDDSDEQRQLIKTMIRNLLPAHQKPANIYFGH